MVLSAYFTKIPFKINPDPLRRREEVWKMLYWIIFLGNPINCLVPTYSLNIVGIIVVTTTNFIGIGLNRGLLNLCVDLANNLIQLFLSSYCNFSALGSNSGWLF